MGVAARHGLLVRDAQALEWAGQLKVVAFDKTGTLTEGRPRLVSLELPSPAAGGHQSLLAIASALQAGSSHPLAKAVREASPTSQEAEPKVSGLSTSPGRGVEGEVAGQRWRLGSHAWSEASLDRPDWQAGLPGTDPLCTYAWLLAQAADGHWQLMARLGFRDEIKPTAKATVDALKALGVQSWLLSGDRLEVVEHWGRALGISHIQGEVLPEHKADALAQARAGLSPDEKLGMVGDGLNDAPALAVACHAGLIGQALRHRPDGAAGRDKHRFADLRLGGTRQNLAQVKLGLLKRVAMPQRLLARWGGHKDQLVSLRHPLAQAFGLVVGANDGRDQWMRQNIEQVVVAKCFRGLQQDPVATLNQHPTDMTANE